VSTELRFTRVTVKSVPIRACDRLHRGGKMAKKTKRRKEQGTSTKGPVIKESVNIPLEHPVYDHGRSSFISFLQDSALIINSTRS
jgi:hypothetical protein